MNRPLRVALADDYSAIRMILRTLLRTDPEIVLVGEAHSATDVITLCQKEQPEIVLLDLFMPGLTAPFTVRSLLASFPELKIIIISEEDDDVFVHAMTQLPICGYLLKGDAADCLLEAIHAVADGASWYSPSIRALLGKNPLSP
jgi:DNA-binding NarL/FixJ family response regulator